jgi:hypothetical protein
MSKGEEVIKERCRESFGECWKIAGDKTISRMKDASLVLPDQVIYSFDITLLLVSSSSDSRYCVP